MAMDLKQDMVVHGRSGQRAEYRPLDWGCSPTAEPRGYVKAIRPKYLYIADLDRIEGTGSHDRVIAECAGMVSRCYVDRGCRSPEDLLSGYHITNVIGTETGGDNLSQYKGGFLSLDIRDGRVIPYGRDPVEILHQANSWKFEGCIVLDIGAVGTESGINQDMVRVMRSAYYRKLFWGGGVAAASDLKALSEAGFDGAIIATVLHHKKIPPAWIRRGQIC